MLIPTKVRYTLHHDPNQHMPVVSNDISYANAGITSQLSLHTSFYRKVFFVGVLHKMSNVIYAKKQFICDRSQPFIYGTSFQPVPEPLTTLQEAQGMHPVIDIT